MKNFKARLKRLEQLEKKLDPVPNIVIYKPGEELPKTKTKFVVYLPDNGRGKANEAIGKK